MVLAQQGDGSQHVLAALLVVLQFHAVARLKDHFQDVVFFAVLGRATGLRNICWAQTKTVVAHTW